MRWKHKFKPKLQLGDLVLHRSFCLLPVQIDDTTVWLEYVWVVSQYHENDFGLKTLGRREGYLTLEDAVEVIQKSRWVTDAHKYVHLDGEWSLFVDWIEGEIND